MFLLITCTVCVIVKLPPACQINATNVVTVIVLIEAVVIASRSPLVKQFTSIVCQSNAYTGKIVKQRAW